MYPDRLWKWAVLAVLVVALPNWGQGPQKEPGPAKPRFDLHGDPLPKGALCRLGTVRFRHGGAVYAVAFSEDGKLIAASSFDPNMLVIWERATGRKIREIPFVGRHVPPTLLCFGPVGKHLYGFSHTLDSTFFVWDLETGAHLKGLDSPPREARAVGYSPDGREVILIHEETNVVRWGIEKGKELERHSSPVRRPSTAALVGQRLLAARFDGKSVSMWDVVQKKQLWSVRATRREFYHDLPMAFSADGKIFAVEAPAQVISVYESLGGKMVRQLQSDVGNIYYSVSISPDARTVAGSNWDGSLHLWELETGREQAKIPGIRGWGTTVYFAPDSKSFATGDQNNPHAVLLWETATGKPIEPFPGHSNPVSSVAFSPDGQTVATSSSLRGDPFLRLWDPQTGRPLRSLETHMGGGVSALAYSPDGGTIAVCDRGGEKKVRIWDAKTGRERHALTGHEAGCTCVAFSSDGKILASGDDFYNRTGGCEGRLCLWDVQNGKKIREIRGTPGSIRQVLFTRGGRHLLVAAYGVYIYDADSGQQVVEPFLTDTAVWNLTLSADGRLLAVGTDKDRAVRLWELATRCEIPLAVNTKKSSGLDLSPDGRILAISTQSGGMSLFHWPSGQTIGRVSGPASIGSPVVFSGDGRQLATSVRSESSVLIWDVAALVDRPLSVVAKPAEADLKRWWADLLESPTTAYKAVWQFAAVPEQALPFFADTLQLIKIPEPDAVARLIDGLGSPQFEVRQKSLRELEQLGDAVADILRKTKKGSVEQARRVEQLLAKVAGPVPGPEQLRSIRAVAVLEQIGGPHARKILEGLATGAPSARLTQEARATLQRLEQAEKSREST